MSHIPLISIIAAVALLLFLIYAVTRERKLAWVMREASVISQTAAIPAFKAALPEFEKELARARRNQRPLTLAVLEIEDDELLENIGILVSGNTEPSTAAYRQAMQTVRIVFLLIGTILRDAMREFDVIAYDVTNDDYVILLPDVGQGEAAAAIERMRALLHDRIMASAQVGFAEFPKEGLTVDALIGSARAARIPAAAPATAPVEAAA